MGFADRLKKLDKSIKKKKERKKKEEEKKLAEAQKKYDSMLAAMTPAERKAHEIAEKERLKDALAGHESAGSFNVLSIDWEKRKLEQEKKRKEEERKQWEKDMKMFEKTTMRRETREMEAEDKLSAIFSAIENRSRHYKKLVDLEKQRQEELKLKKQKEQEELEKTTSAGFTFKRSNFKRAIKNKPTEGRLIKCFTAHKQPAKRVYFDESGLYLITCGMDKLIKVWSVRSEKCVHGFSGHTTGVTCCSTLGSWNDKSPRRGKRFRLMSCDGAGKVCFWEENNERPIILRKVHDMTIYDCAFCPQNDGKWALTCSEDSTLRVIETATANVLFQFRGTKGAVTSCAWSPNGHIAISGGGFADTCIRLWDVSNAVIFMYILKEEYAKAIETFEEKVASTGFGMWPSYNTLNALVEVYLTRGDPQIGCIIFEEMMSRSMKPTEKVVELLRKFVRDPRKFWQEERKQEEYDSDDMNIENDDDWNDTDEEDKENDIKESSVKRTKISKMYTSVAHMYTGSKNATPQNVERPRSAFASRPVANAKSMQIKPKSTDHTADMIVARTILGSNDQKLVRPASAPYFSTENSRLAKLSIQLASPKIQPASNEIQKIARQVVLQSLHTVLTRVEFVCKKKAYLEEARKRYEEEQFRKGQQGTLGKFNVAAKKVETKPRLPFIKLSLETDAPDLLTALGRLHTEVTAHSGLIGKRRLFQALNFKVRPGTEIDSDKDPRAKKAMITRFLRQKRRAKRLKRLLDKSIFQMDKILDRVMGNQPWITDTPDGGSGVSTFLLRVFDRTKGHGDWVNDVIFTPDGRYIFSAGSDNTVKLWDPQEGKLLQTLRGHPGWVNCISIMPDGEWVLVGSEDELIVWNFSKILARVEEEKSIQEREERKELERIEREKRNEKRRLEAEELHNQKVKNSKKIGNILIGNTVHSRKYKRRKAAQEEQWKEEEELEQKRLEEEEQNEKQISDLLPLKPDSILKGHVDLIYHISCQNDCRRIASVSHDMQACIWQIVPGEPDQLYDRPFPTEVTTTTMRINWIAPSENGKPITHYRLTRRLEEQYDYGDEVTIPPCNSPYGFLDKTRSYVIRNLRPGTVYEFKLAAVNEKGSAIFSKAMMGRRTATTIPWPIKERPEILSQKARSCVLRWVSPVSFGIVVTSFRIQMRGGSIFKFGDVEDIVISIKDAIALAKKHGAAFQRRQERLKKESSKWGKFGRRKRKPAKVIQFEENPTFVRKEDKELGTVPEVACEIKNLKPGSVYMFRVAGINRKGQGDYSPSSYSIVTDALPPSRMQRVSADRVTPFSMRIHFSAPNTNGNIIEGYRVFYGKCASPIDKSERLLKAAEHSRTLLPDRDYDDYWTPPSRFDVEKKALQIMPAMEGKLRQKYCDWSEMNGTFFDIDGLMPGTNYIFCISARNAQGYGDISPVSDIMRTGCSPPSPPKQPYLGDVTSTTVVVNFTLPNGNGANVSEMKICLLEGKGNHASYRPEIHLHIKDAIVKSDENMELELDVLYRNAKDPERSFHYKIGNLIGDQFYKVKVAGINEEGQGAFSQFCPEISTLLPTVPSIPSEKITVDDVTPEKVIMHFGQAKLNGGSPIAGYIIACRAIGGRDRHPEKNNQLNEFGDETEDVNGINSIKLKDGLLVLPEGYELAGATMANVTKFTFQKPKIRAFYTFKVCCYNRVGQSPFTDSPPSIQVPSKVEYIAKQQKLKMERIAAEKKRRAEAKKKALQDRAVR